MLGYSAPDAGVSIYSLKSPERFDAMVKVLVAGYGVIGQRLADGVALQDDMELVGVVDAAPTLSVLSLRDKGMPYKLFAAFDSAKADLEAAGLTIAGTLEEILPEVDIVLDATSPGVGAKNKELYAKHGKKAVFQGGEKMRSQTSSFTATPTTKKVLTKIS